MHVLLEGMPAALCETCMWDAVVDMANQLTAQNFALRNACRYNARVAAPHTLSTCGMPDACKPGSASSSCSACSIM